MSNAGSQMSNAEGGQPPRNGRVVTFYSFKGGTGRTMALANVAWVLAANGKRVLVADWDLESPGLHRFFQPFLDAKISERPGIVDFIRRYEWAAVDAGIKPEALEIGTEESKQAARDAVTELIAPHIAKVMTYPIPLNWDFPGGGALHFLSSGRQGNGDYQMGLGALDWDNFYDELHGGRFFDALRILMKDEYDYALIDSRTGLSDVADICTVHLPDVVVDCFTLATQGIAGAADIAMKIQAHTERSITILPVPMRIDHTRKAKVDAGLALANELFKGLPAGMPEEQRNEYWAEVQVPYRPNYAYEETLATIGDRPGSDTGLLPSYERITARITQGSVTTLPPREEWRRLRTGLLFSRTQLATSAEFVLDFSPEDQLWAEWIAAVLASAEITVRWPGEQLHITDDTEMDRHTIAVASEYYLSRKAGSLLAEPPYLLISVSERRLSAELRAKANIVSLTGASETQAVDRLVEQFGKRRSADLESAIGGLRYPGGDRPQIVNVPARNLNFTGRDEDLRKLREELRLQGMTVVLPLTIQGLGGVGKTQLALEYAHRFRADYDIIWWMNCGQPQYVDASLFDLGDQLRRVFEAGVPEEGGVSEVVQQVLRLLSEGIAGLRWLLIYDNAEDIAEIKNLLPGGGGHVLITSRDEDWTNENAISLPIDVFKRQESVSHLRHRVDGITDAEADEVAEILGDMPLAVAAAGALLASAGMSVPEYLEKLSQQPARTYPVGNPLRDYTPMVAKAWHLSLDYLQETSAAAAWLLGICSIMAPDISLSLIDTQAMADSLRELDSNITEQAMIAKLIWQIDQLALIKLDNNVRQIQVHRVVQTVVNDRMTVGEKEAARRAVRQLLVAARPEGEVDDPQTWPRYRLIWPHLRPSDAVESSEVRVRQLLIERVRYMWQREDLGRGRRRAKEIERIWQGMVAREVDPEVAKSLRGQLFRLQFNLANILRDLAEFQEARSMDEMVLRGQAELLGPESPQTLQTKGSLAADRRALGDYTAALALDKETYESWRRSFGDMYRGTLAAAHNMALSFLLTGDFRSALAHDRLTLERRTSVLREVPDPRTLGSGAAVARDLLEAGRYQEAVTRIEGVWTQSNDILGASDRTTLTARMLLGVAQRCAGHHEQAEEHLEGARLGLTHGFGKDSTDALACRLSQALNKLPAGHPLDARNAARDVLEVYEGRLGSEHPHPLICKLNIATASCLMGDYQSAEADARFVADGLRNGLGPAHPYTLSAMMVLASIRAYQEDLREARQLEEAVTAERDKVLGPEHPDSLRSHANLLLTIKAQGEDGTSEIRRVVQEELEERLGDHHPDVTAVINGGRLLCAIDPQPF